MFTFVSVLIVCFIVIILVLGLTIFTINKGYQYEHKVDPLPEQPPYDYNESSQHEKAE